MRDATDTLVLIQWVIFALLMGFLLGLVFTSNHAHKAGVNHSRHIMTQWVETCWPNKPVWTAGPGMCWIDGQRVLVGD